MMQELDKRSFMPDVVQVESTDDFKLYIYCSDGLVRLFDAKPLLDAGTVFAPLLNVEEFKQRLTVINGCVAWDITGDKETYQCIDFDPCMLLDLPVVCKIKKDEDTA